MGDLAVLDHLEHCGLASPVTGVPGPEIRPPALKGLLLTSPVYGAMHHVGDVCPLTGADHVLPKRNLFGGVPAGGDRRQEEHPVAALHGAVDALLVKQVTAHHLYIGTQLFQLRELRVALQGESADLEALGKQFLDDGEALRSGGACHENLVHIEYSFSIKFSKILRFRNLASYASWRDCQDFFAACCSRR